MYFWEPWATGPLANSAHFSFQYAIHGDLSKGQADFVK